jgi:hypothetical protein
MKKQSECAISSQRLILFALRIQDKCGSSEAEKNVTKRGEQSVAYRERSPRGIQDDATQRLQPEPDAKG